LDQASKSRKGALSWNREGSAMPSRREELEQARQHVRDIQHRVEQQTLLIHRLHSDGYETAAAERLLATFIDLMDRLTLSSGASGTSSMTGQP
jgi:hypothetical protein